MAGTAGKPRHSHSQPQQDSAKTYIYKQSPVLHPSRTHSAQIPLVLSLLLTLQDLLSTILELLHIAFTALANHTYTDHFHLEKTPTSATMTKQVSSTAEMIDYLIAFFLPPVGVFLRRGCNADFFINILLCSESPSAIALPVLQETSH